MINYYHKVQKREKKKTSSDLFAAINLESYWVLMAWMNCLKIFSKASCLIQEKVFSNTFLMLSARHEAGMKVRRYYDTALPEFVGYTSADADSYITKYLSNHEDPSLAKKMIKKLSQNLQLRELTANPLNTALLCLVCEDARGMLLSNRTKLYFELVSCALRRYHAKKGIPLDDNDPIEVCADQLSQLGKLALEALLKNQLAFCEAVLKGQSTELVESYSRSKCK